MTGHEMDDRLAPVLRPVRAGNGFEEALEQILQIVRLGLVPQGERLPAERELAERLHISRVTLREVLKVLQDQGLVESRRGRYGGTFVLARTRSASEEEVRRRVAAVDVEDTLRFREVLEVGAAGLCATHGLTGEQTRRLRAALAATHDAPLADYRRLDTLLHLTLAELSGSVTLAAQYAPSASRSSTASTSAVCCRCECSRLRTSSGMPSSRSLTVARTAAYCAASVTDPDSSASVRCSRVSRRR